MTTGKFIFLLLFLQFYFICSNVWSQSKDYTSTYSEKQKQEIIQQFLKDCSFNEDYCRCLIIDIIKNIPYRKLGSLKYGNQYNEAMNSCKEFRKSYPSPFPPPDLRILDFKFSGVNDKDYLEANDLAFLTFTVRNVGKGMAYDLIVKTQENKLFNGLQYNEVKIGDLKPEEERFVSIDLRADQLISTGQVILESEVIEGNRFNVKSNPLVLETLEFQAPDVRIINYDITTNSGKLQRSEEALLTAEIQNIGKGIAKNVNIQIVYPENTFSSTTNKSGIQELKPGETVKISSKFLCNTSFFDSIVTIFFDLNESEQKYATDTSIRVKINQPIIPVSLMAISDIERDIPVNPEMKPHRFALIIGNEDYTSFQKGLGKEANVMYAINDAKTFKDYARNLLGIPKENCRLVTNATSAKMNLEIELISALINRTGTDCELFFYFAGHGLPEEGTNIPYLIPVDVNTNNLTSGVKTSELYQKFSESGAKRITIILDACFSGGGRDMGLLAARSIRIKPVEDLPQGNMVIFTATSGNQTALPFKEKRHGLYTYFLLKKLKETKGNITYNDMDEYLKKEVARQSLLVNEKLQDPLTRVSSSIFNEWGSWKFK